MGLIVSFITSIFVAGMGWSTLNAKLTNVESQVKSQTVDLAGMHNTQVTMQCDLQYIRGQLDMVIKNTKTKRDNTNITLGQKW